MSALGRKLTDAERAELQAQVDAMGGSHRRGRRRWGVDARTPRRTTLTALNTGPEGMPCRICKKVHHVGDEVQSANFAVGGTIACVDHAFYAPGEVR